MPATIDLEHDELLTLGQACRLLPRKPSPPTLWRWRVKGVKINGQCIKLEAVRCGGVWVTTQAAMVDFIERQTTAATPATDDQPDETRSPATERRLAAAGLV